VQCSPAGLLGRIAHASFSTLGTKLAKNLTDLSAMRKFGMGQGKKAPNLIPLVDLSGPSKGAFSQEGINLGFFLHFI
jgi:hypothetical protein